MKKFIELNKIDISQRNNNEIYRVNIIGKFLLDITKIIMIDMPIESKDDCKYSKVIRKVYIPDNEFYIIEQDYERIIEVLKILNYF